MIRRSRDAKFIIYQVLYIFVITVLALKGAEINLGEVVKKEDVVQKSVRDSLITIVDSLTSLGIDFNIEIDTNVVEENKELKQKLTVLNSQFASLSKRVKNIPKLDPVKYNKKQKLKSTLPSPFSKSQTFLKYATNVAENKGDYSVIVYDPIAKKQLIKIPPHEKREFELSNQDEVILKFGYQEEVIKVDRNLPPEILIEKVTTKMDKSDIYAKDLQRTTCFTVKIQDERPEQIKVTHSGPISVTGPQKDKKGNLIYNISLNLAANEDRFNKWVDRNEHLIDSEDRYKANFFFTAFDVKSKQKVQVGESFYFTEFSK